MLQAITYTNGADVIAAAKDMRKRLWKKTGIVDPFMMTAKQKADREAQIERDRKAAEVLHRQRFLDEKAKAEIEALRIAEMAHPITPRKANAFQGTPKSRLIEMCEKSGVDYYDIIGPSRREVFTEVRHRLVGAMYLEMTKGGKEFSLHQMGKLFSRDHSTIINSLKRCGILPNARPLKGRKTKLPKSGFTGIIAMPNGKHRAEIHHGGLKYAAGTYDTIERAIEARDILKKSIDAKSPLSVWEVYRLMWVQK